MSPVPHRLEPLFVEKIWGTTQLEPWFPNSQGKVGEVWFPADRILFKFLYATERLSVQVHPAKTEMWYVLRAEPDARIALGFREPFPKERLREVAVSGEIEHLLDWGPVSAGDAILVRTGTVHALSAGLVMAEIQQNAPVTYRLYDYGRPRKLQLDQAVEVAHCEPHPGKESPVALPEGGQRLVACEYFVTDLFRWDRPLRYRPPTADYHLLVFLEGSGTIAGERFRPGHVWRVPAGSESFSLAPDQPARVLLSYPPPR